MEGDEQIKTIGRNIRNRRKAIGLTSTELGSMTGIDRSSLCKIERGEVNITIGTLIIISEFLKIETYVLLIK